MKETCSAVKRRSCWVYGGIFKESSITNLDNNQSLLISKVNSFVVWKQLWIALVNRKGVILYHVCSCTAQLIKELFEELSWEKLLHPQYSPNIAPSDYHLFRSLQKYLDGIRLTSREEFEHEVTWQQSLKVSMVRKCVLQDLSPENCWQYVNSCKSLLTQQHFGLACYCWKIHPLS